MARWSHVTMSPEVSVINPELGRAAFGSAILIFIVALGSAEFAITLLSLIIGVVFIGVIALFVRVIGR